MTAFEELRKEADMLERFAHAYRKRLADAINQLNRKPSAASGDAACLRLCVETMDMLLVSQHQLAKSLSRLPGERAAA